jgi:hypothetical protein
LLWKRHGDRDLLIGVLGCWPGRTSAAWLILIGWFLVTWPAPNSNRMRSWGALAGMLVRDIMLADPDFGAAWSDVADWTPAWSASRVATHRPVTDRHARIAGRLCGVRQRRLPQTWPCHLP